MPPYRRLFRLFLGARDIERELDEEIEAHLAMRTEELVRRGMAPEQAREEAARRFGDLTLARRRLRASARRREGRLRGLEWGESVLRDLTLAGRRMRAAPGTTLLTILTFALGIGLTTTGFTMVDHVLVRDLPYPDPDRLVSLQMVDSAGQSIEVVSSDAWLDWRERGRTLASSAIRLPRNPAVSGAEGAFRVEGQLVTASFFDVITTPMLLGRPFTEIEAREGERVAAVSEAFWRAYLGGAALPAEVSFDNRTFQVVGVVPAGRGYPAGTQVWLPTHPRRRGGAAYNNINWQGVGRLAPGVTMEQAMADLSSVARAIRGENPEALYSHGVRMRPLHDLIVGRSREHLELLMGAVLFVLLLVCANLAGLGLARASTRGPEVAVRVALGAGRRRVLRQLLTEHLLLGLVGGGLGVLLAWTSTRLLVSHAAAHIPRAEEIALDGRVLGFALSITLVAALLAGIAPALRASAASLGAALREGPRSAAGGKGLPGAVLVATEVALAVVLLTGGGLLLRSFQSIVGREVGFRTEGVITADIALTSERYRAREDLQLDYWERLLTRVRALPGVEAAAVANWIPTGDAGTSFIEIPGRPDDAAGAGYRVVSDDYFRTLGIPLLAGRTFEEGDRPGSRRVALVNRAMAERYWPGDSPIGQTVRALSMEDIIDAPPITIVGMVGDVRHEGYMDEPAPEMYVLYRQAPPPWTSGMTVVARAPAATSATLAAVRRAAREVDPDLAVELNTLERRLGELVSARRLVMALLGGFGVLALLLAAIGLYGLLSFAVALRAREMGIRAALGAESRALVRLMLLSALRVTAVGAAAGLLAAFWLSRLLESQLVDVPATDPVSYAAAAVALLAVCLGAALPPARRAARADPAAVLKAV